MRCRFFQVLQHVVQRLDALARDIEHHEVALCSLFRVLGTLQIAHAFAMLARERKRAFLRRGEFELAFGKLARKSCSRSYAMARAPEISLMRSSASVRETRKASMAWPSSTTSGSVLASSTFTRAKSSATLFCDA